MSWALEPVPPAIEEEPSVVRITSNTMRLYLSFWRMNKKNPTFGSVNDVAVAEVALEAICAKFVENYSRDMGGRSTREWSCGAGVVVEVRIGAIAKTRGQLVSKSLVLS